MQCIQQTKGPVYMHMCKQSVPTPKVGGTSDLGWVTLNNLNNAVWRNIQNAEESRFRFRQMPSTQPRGGDVNVHSGYVASRIKMKKREREIERLREQINPVHSCIYEQPSFPVCINRQTYIQSEQLHVWIHTTININWRSTTSSGNPWGKRHTKWITWRLNNVSEAVLALMPRSEFKDFS